MCLTVCSTMWRIFRVWQRFCLLCRYNQRGANQSDQNSMVNRLKDIFLRFSVCWAAFDSSWLVAEWDVLHGMLNHDLVWMGDQAPSDRVCPVKKIMSASMSRTYTTIHTRYLLAATDSTICAYQHCRSFNNEIRKLNLIVKSFISRLSNKSL